MEEARAPAVFFEVYDDGAVDHVGVGFLEGMGKVGAEEVDITGGVVTDVVADVTGTAAFGEDDELVFDVLMPADFEMRSAEGLR